MNIKSILLCTLFLSPSLYASEYLPDQGIASKPTGERGDSAALINAVSKGDYELVESLLKNKADVNGWDTLKYTKWTPLMEAAREGSDLTTHLLLEAKANPHDEDIEGCTAFSYAVACDRFFAARRLLKTKAIDINKKNKQGETPLFSAASGGHDEMVRFLLKHKAEVNVQGIKEQTPLMRAASAGHEVIVSLLLDHKANADLKDKDGKSARMHADYQKDTLVSSSDKCRKYASIAKEIRSKESVSSQSLFIKTEDIGRFLDTGMVPGSPEDW